MRFPTASKTMTNEELLKEIAELTDYMNQREADLQTATDLGTTLLERNRALTEELDDTKERLGGQLMNSHSRIVTLEKDLKDLKAQHQHTVDQLHMQGESTLRMENSEQMLIEEVEKQKALIEHLKHDTAELSPLKKQIDVLSEQLNEKVTELATATALVQELTSNAHRTKDSHHRELEMMSEDIQSLSAQLEQASAGKKRSDARVKQLEEQISEMKVASVATPDASVLESEYKESMRRNVQLEKELDAAMTLYRELREQHDNLRAEYIELERRQTEGADSDDEDLLVQQLRLTENEVADLQNQLSVTTEQYSLLESELNETKMALSQVQGRSFMNDSSAPVTPHHMPMASTPLIKFPPSGSAQQMQEGDTVSIVAPFTRFNTSSPSDTTQPTVNISPVTTTTGQADSTPVVVTETTPHHTSGVSKERSSLGVTFSPDSKMESIRAPSPASELRGRSPSLRISDGSSSSPAMGALDIITASERAQGDLYNLVSKLVDAKADPSVIKEVEAVRSMLANAVVSKARARPGSIRGSIGIVQAAGPQEAASAARKIRTLNLDSLSLEKLRSVLPASPTTPTGTGHRSSFTPLDPQRQQELWNQIERSGESPTLTVPPAGSRFKGDQGRALEFHSTESDPLRAKRQSLAATVASLQRPLSIRSKASAGSHYRSTDTIPLVSLTDTIAHTLRWQQGPTSFLFDMATGNPTVTEPKEKPAFVMPLAGATMTSFMDSKVPFCFMLNVQGKTYKLAASTQSEMLDWMELISEHSNPTPDKMVRARSETTIV